MQAFILCGGQGTRIRGVADDVPKPMVPIGGRPMLWHIMKGYARHGVREFVLLLGYRGDVVREYFLNYRAMTSDVAITLGGGIEYLGPEGDEAGWRVVLAETGDRAQTGARLFRAATRYARGTFLATYGDGVSDVDVTKLLAFHRSHGKLATITGVRPPGRFGEMEVEGSRVVRFNEKPQTSAGRINGGFFVFEPAFVERYLGAADDMVLEREALMRAVHDGELMVHEHDGFWMPMDTFREWTQLNALWDAGSAPWKTW